VTDALLLDTHIALWLDSGDDRLCSATHRDPADRLLIAPAIEFACPLVTYDERILALAEGMVGNTGFRQRMSPTAQPKRWAREPVEGERPADLFVDADLREMASRWR
jgi:hypothetical protein